MNEGLEIMLLEFYVIDVSCWLRYEETIRHLNELLLLRDDT